MPPIKLDLISPTNQDVKYLGEITSLGSIDSTKQSFDPNGLYSVEYFGVSGSEERALRFAYINIKLNIIHPKLYEAIVSLSTLYEKILKGTAYVRLDTKEKDFVLDDNGNTGYQFFIDNIIKVKFKRNESKQRDLKIDMIYKFIKEGKLTYNKLLVLPAGLRDYEIGKDGRPSEDEINDYYRAILRDSDLIASVNIPKDELNMLDPIRIKLQLDINKIYNYIKTLIDGKHKFIRGSWVKRGVDYGTRNIFSAIPIKIKSIDDTDHVIKPYETIAGVFQVAKAFLPLTYYNLNKYFLSNIISPTGNTANLVDPKTLKQKTVELTKTEFDKWSTQDGIDSIINRTIDDEVKNSPIVIDGYYLKLIYDTGKTVRLIDDIDLEPELEKKYLRPITYGEMLYLSLKDVVKKYPATIARDPIIEEGSTYYTMIKLYTTTEDRVVTFENDGEVLYHYPLPKYKWVNTIGLHYSRLKSLGADFDGDTGPLIGYLTTDAAEEARKLMNSKDFYVTATGKPALDIVDDIVDKTIQYIYKG